VRNRPTLNIPGLLESVFVAVRCPSGRGIRAFTGNQGCPKLSAGLGGLAFALDFGDKALAHVQCIYYGTSPEVSPVKWRAGVCRLRPCCIDGRLSLSRYPGYFEIIVAMRDGRRAVRQLHDRLAGVYDRRWSRYISQTLAFLKTWVSLPPRAAVLDVGCGTGEFERLMVSEYPEQLIVGIDLSAKMLEIAQEKCQAHPNVTFCIASAAALPFADHSFDVVVSASALHYFDQPALSLGEMRRVLKPGGSAVILDWCKDYLVCRLFDLVLKLIEPAYQQCYTQPEFHRLLAAAQFKIQSAGRVRFGLLWGLMIATAVNPESG